MAWFKEKQNTSYIRNFCSNVLKAGEIPKHVAIIMDGNRRFAKKVHCERAKGHERGFEKLTEVLEWCFELGIPEVTVYAFSIENFKRSKDEVDCLMELAKQKFDRLLEEREMMEKHGVCIRVLGDLLLLPQDVQRSVARAINFSKHNTKAILNVCLAYTSRHEISEAVKTLAEGVESGQLKPGDVSESLLEKCLYTHKSQEPDLLIRTSGEIRFSDFLLWQCSYSSLAFLKVLWPEFSVWNFYYAILSYQWNYKALQDLQKNVTQERQRTEQERDQETVLEQLRSENISITNGTRANGNGHLGGSHFEDLLKKPALKKRVEQYQHEKRQRIENFINGLEEQRAHYLETMSTVDDSIGNRESVRSVFKEGNVGGIARG